jgi:hypothetical protein
MGKNLRKHKLYLTVEFEQVESVGHDYLELNVFLKGQDFNPNEAIASVISDFKSDTLNDNHLDILFCALGYVVGGIETLLDFLSYASLRWDFQYSVAEEIEIWLNGAIPWLIFQYK